MTTHQPTMNEPRNPSIETTAVRPDGFEFARRVERGIQIDPRRFTSEDEALQAIRRADSGAKVLFFDQDHPGSRLVELGAHRPAGVGGCPYERRETPGFVGEFTGEQSKDFRPPAAASDLVSDAACAAWYGRADYIITRAGLVAAEAMRDRRNLTEVDRKRIAAAEAEGWTDIHLEAGSHRPGESERRWVGRKPGFAHGYYLPDAPGHEIKFEFARRKGTDLEVCAAQFSSQPAALAAILSAKPQARVAFYDQEAVGPTPVLLCRPVPGQHRCEWSAAEVCVEDFRSLSADGDLLFQAGQAAHAVQADYVLTRPGLIEAEKQRQAAAGAQTRFEYGERDGTHLEVCPRQFDSREAILADILSGNPDADVIFYDHRDDGAAIEYYGSVDTKMREKQWLDHCFATREYRYAGGVAEEHGGVLHDAACAGHDLGAEFVICPAGLLAAARENQRPRFEIAECVGVELEYRHRRFDDRDAALAAIREEYPSARIAFVDHLDGGTVEVSRPNEEGWEPAGCRASEVLDGVGEDPEKIMLRLAAFAGARDVEFVVGPAGLMPHQAITAAAGTRRAAHAYLPADRSGRETESSKSVL